MGLPEKVKVFTLCDECNKEFEVKLYRTGKESFTTITKCPHCGYYNHRWLRIVF